MNLFESLQILDESFKRSAEDLFENIVSTIQERFGCDIDDTYYDADNYPEKFKARFVVYNFPYKFIVTIEDIIKEKLSHFDNINIDIYKDDDYCTKNIESAHVIQIDAYNDDFNF